MMEDDVPIDAEVREAVGVFMDNESLERAVQDLLTDGGFDHADLSVLASDETIAQRFGHRYQDMREAEDDPDAPRISWVEPESRTQGRGALTGILAYAGAVTAGGITFATGGAAGLVIAAGLAAGAAGGALGLGLGTLIDETIGGRLEEQIRRGGVVLWVRLRQPEQHARATGVLARHGARDVHVHTIRPSPTGPGQVAPGPGQ
ncbi:MAG: hypothetical protein HQL38_18985 [Alphaproteobacteria bacterium]|nr:hypothetical protein [Alphaproteobacteria bacterium]